ncbi:unnamed protein product [Arctogadus glacialis]
MPGKYRVLQGTVHSCPVFSSTDTEWRAECQSSSPTPDCPAHEVHCVEVKVALLLRKRGLEKLVSSTLLCSQQTLAVRPNQD